MSRDFRNGIRISAMIALGLLATSTSMAGRYNRVVDIGDVAPDWQEIEGVDGQLHNLADYEDAKAVVMIFTCNQCPVAAGYERRIIELQKEYESKGVQVIAISVSKHPDDGLASMKERAAASKFNFPYLWDGTQKVGRQYGASVTPQAFVLDAERKFVYMGKIDDSPLDPTSVKRNFVRDAIEAALGGSEPPVTENRAQGCGIMYQ